MSCDANNRAAANAATINGVTKFASKRASYAGGKKEVNATRKKDRGTHQSRQPKAMQTIPKQSVGKISQINWKRRKIIGGGGFALVYQVAPGVVAKVGQIGQKEVEAQRHFARQQQALPVLDYQAEVELPARVSREVCPIHGPRKKILPEDGYLCTCNSPRSVLLMPLADSIEGVSGDEIRAFLMGFSRDCEQQRGHYWDARPANVARYQGRLIALDFGEEEGVSDPVPPGWQPSDMMTTPKQSAP
ncbi:MAG: hypothetical protein DPW09_45810 [Anaerolineae bacterium]|nr:hypothetical protein [Anaerolineae bacterium]